MNKCHCGKELHYQNKTDEQKVQELVDKLGEYLPVTRGNKTFLVQRHWIALHGINQTTDLEAEGFQEVYRSRIGGEKT